MDRPKQHREGIKRGVPLTVRGEQIKSSKSVGCKPAQAQQMTDRLNGQPSGGRRRGPLRTKFCRERRALYDRAHEEMVDHAYPEFAPRGCANGATKVKPRRARELKIQGVIAREIAQVMSVSERTVRRYLNA